MRITTAEIRRALEIVLAEFDESGAAEWEIRHDFYWDALGDGRYDPTSDPQLALGQLSHDLERVKDIAAGDADSVPYALVWIASILRVAGEAGVIDIQPVPPTED